MKKFFALLLALASFVAGSTWSASSTATEPADKTLSPYFQVEGGDSAVDRLPLLSTDVQVDISGVIAHVTVTQTYKNAGAQPINARYVFPASTRAAVHAMTMKLGDRIIRAKIREREQARAEFEAAKRQGKTAALLEEDRPNVFSMGVANIMPGDQLDVTLSYTELLIPENGTYEFVYPTVVGPRYSETPAGSAPAQDRFVASPYLKKGKAPSHELRLSGSIQAAFPVAKVQMPSHQAQLSWPSKSLVEFSLAESERHGPARDFIVRYQLAGKHIQSGITLLEKDNQRFFMAMVAAPERLPRESIPAREYVFVVDVSGSMHGFPIDTAKALLEDLVSELRPSDSFNILFFSGGSNLWKPRSQPATQQNLESALSFLTRLEGRGGTRLLPAMQQALALPHDESLSRSLIVVTDGYISAEADVFQHIRDNLGKANVFSFGIGSSVNRYLVEGIAKAGQGVPFVVTEPAEASAIAAKFRKYIASPALTNVTVQFDGFDAYDVLPKSIPDVLSDRPVIVMGKYKGGAQGKVTVRGMTGRGTFSKSLPVDPAQATSRQSALPYLWARTSISELSDFAPNPIPKQTRRQVVELGLEYNLLTPYTSFVAVAEQVRNTKGAAANVDQPLPLPAGVSERAVSTSVVGADEPGLLWLLLAMGVLLGGLALKQRWALL